MWQKNKVWREMRIYEKVSFVLGVFCSFMVIILNSLRLIGVMENALKISNLFSGVLLITLGVLNCRKNRTLAVFCWMVAIFTFIVLIMI